jgi:hypothetical protein
VDEAQRLFDRDPVVADRLVDAVFPSLEGLIRRRDALWVRMNAAADADSDDYYSLFDEWHEASDAVAEWQEDSE